MGAPGDGQCDGRVGPPFRRRPTYGSGAPARSDDSTDEQG